MSEQKIPLSGVQETLVLPLWGRAIETQKAAPKLVDETAVKIVNSLDYDFSEIEKKINPLSRAAWIARSLYFDAKIREYLQQHPDGSIINVGCGLDTTYDRVNNNRATWYELDFPEVIDIRRQYMRESPNRHFLAGSVLDTGWTDKITHKSNVFLLFAGVIYYFEETQVKDLFGTFSKTFRGCNVACDYSSPKGVEIANKRVLRDSGMDENACLKWGIKDIRDIESWSDHIHVLHNMKMFEEYKKAYPPLKRIGMSISDAMSVMSLAHIRIDAV